MDKEGYFAANRLFWTNGAINELYNQCVDPETGEMTEDFEQRLELLLRELDENKDDAINTIKSKQVLIEARKKEIERLQKANASDERTIANIKEALAAVLEEQKYKSTVGSVSYRHSRAINILDSERLIEWASDKYEGIITYAKPTVSKTEVGKLLEKGIEIPYTEVEERVSVIVR